MKEIIDKLSTYNLFNYQYSGKNLTLTINNHLFVNTRWMG